MEQTTGNLGINKLANVLHKRVKESIFANEFLPLDYGEIKADYSLHTNSFPIPIPRSDYFICAQLSGHSGATIMIESSGIHTHDGGQHSGHKDGDGNHTHLGGTHTHTVNLPNQSTGLKPGDRVIVAWVGNDAVVIDKILPAKEVLK